MERTTPVLLVLCSGFFHLTLASNRLLAFESVTDPDRANCLNAIQECKKKNGSLVTLYNEEDAEVIKNLAAIKDGKIWLGLHKSPDSVPKWSDGAAITFNQSRVHVANGEQTCEAIEKDKWKGFNCSDRKHFMCYKGQDYFLMENMTMNWCEAQAHCRRQFTDLVGIRNETQNQRVIREGKNKTFWIGLMHDNWAWDNGGCSTYREWHNTSSNDAEWNCTIMIGTQLSTHKSDSEQVVLCSKGSVRINVVRETLTWEQAYNHCRARQWRLLQVKDIRDQEAVERWLSNSGGVHADAFWIALRQSRVFGFWIWSDTTVDWNNWQDGRIPEKPMSNNCGVIQKGNYMWRDENCEQLHPFLCEEDLPTKTEPKG